MTYARDLLEQAAGLVVLDKKRPRQVNLRSAVSSGYYSLFHLLTIEASRRFCPSSRPALRLRVARCLDHSEMRAVCKQVAAGNPSEAIKALGLLTFSPSLQEIANIFIEVQEERHTADYDLAYNYNRVEVQNLQKRVQAALDQWSSIRNTNEADIFLAALLFARRWSR